MQLTTSCGMLDTARLPATYEPACCAKCGDRVGWIHSEHAESFVGLCDGCAALVTQGSMPDPFVVTA
jgi:hypothetical protein